MYFYAYLYTNGYLYKSILIKMLFYILWFYHKIVTFGNMVKYLLISLFSILSFYFNFV